MVDLSRFVVGKGIRGGGEAYGSILRERDPVGSLGRRLAVRAIEWEGAVVGALEGLWGPNPAIVEVCWRW